MGTLHFCLLSPGVAPCLLLLLLPPTFARECAELCVARVGGGLGVEGVAVLRTLLVLREEDEDEVEEGRCRRLLEMLEEHKEERRARPEQYIEPYREEVIGPLQRMGWQEGEILQVLAWFDVNSFSVVARAGGGRGRGLFPLASLLNHGCVSNTRRLVSGARLEVRASLPVCCGEALTTHYISPLLPRTTRRRHLAATHHFQCRCQRCLSPTDLGAHTSALRCLGCREGWLLPPGELGAGSYCCTSCSCLLPVQDVEAREASLRPLVEEVQVCTSSKVQDLEGLLNKLEEQFHPRHSFALMVKVELANRLGQEMELDGVKQEVIVRRKEVLEELLEVMTILHPGLSRWRGVLLYQLGQTLVEVVRRGGEGGTVLEVLQEGVRCLQYDRGDSEEAGMCQKMSQMLNDMS